MLPDRVSNPGPLTYESGALPIALRGPALNSKYMYMYMVRLSFKRKSYNKKGVVHVILDFKRRSSTITAYLMGSVVITFDIGDRLLFKCRGWGRGGLNAGGHVKFHAASRWCHPI